MLSVSHAQAWTVPRGAMRCMSAPSKEYFGGFELILRRAANIISNVTDRQPSRMLEVYSEGKMFPLFASTPRYLAVTGFTVDTGAVKSLSAMGYYSEVDVVNASSTGELPYNQRSFQVASMLRPSTFAGVAEMPVNTHVPLEEFVRVLGDKGYGLVGADEESWNVEGTMDTLLEMADVDVLSVQRLDLAAPPITDDLEAEADISDGHEEHGYLLAVVRRV